MDEDVEIALGVVREHSTKAVAQDAGVAREAVFEGAVLSALISSASAMTGEQSCHASEVLSGLRDLLPTLALPATVVETVVERLDAGDAERAAAQRRHSQRALLAAPNPHGRAALDYAASYDAFDAAG